MVFLQASRDDSDVHPHHLLSAALETSVNTQLSTKSCDRWGAGHIKNETCQAPSGCCERKEPGRHPETAKGRQRCGSGGGADGAAK